MTNSIAAGIVLVVAATVAADLLHFGWDLHLFAGRRLVELLETLAIWR